MNWLVDEKSGPSTTPLASSQTRNGAKRLYEYLYDGKAVLFRRVNVPTLADKKTSSIVKNELRIIRMFNSAFDGAGAKEGDYYPRELRPRSIA